MDINNIPPNLIKALEQKNTEQLVALARLLNLTLGKQVQAIITEVTPVTPAERQALLKQTAEALVQINKQVNNPAQIPPTIKAEIGRLMEQQQLIKSPELKWVNLVVNNRALLTYTDKPLQQGQTVPVQLTGPQRLVLVELPAQNLSPNSVTTEINTSNKLNSPVATTNVIPEETTLNKIITEQTKFTPATTLLKENNNQQPTHTSLPNAQKQDALLPLTKNITVNNNANELINGNKIASQNILKALSNNQINNHTSFTTKNIENKQIIADQLRQLLPNQAVVSPFYAALSQWQQIPQSKKQELVSPTLEQALKSLADKIRTPLELSQPKLLANVIKNSGVFFESKLNQHLQQNPSNNSNNPISNQQENKQATSRIYAQDTKGTLLNVLSQATKSLALASNSTLGNLASPLQLKIPLSATINENENFSAGLVDLLKQISGKPTKDGNDKELRIKLLTLLQQHSLLSISKIQLQQLHSLNHDIDNKDGLQQASSWQLEIPVKHNHDIQQLHVRIDREWVEEKDSSKASKTEIKKTKQWSVTLRFDLPSLGEFCAQMTIIDTSVSATLWAARAHTLEQVRKKMDWLREQLEHEGVNVKQLQCLQGMPPEKPMKLSYSLIDIST